MPIHLPNCCFRLKYIHRINGNQYLLYDLADTFSQSNLQLIWLSRRHTPCSNVGLRALLKGPTAVQIVSWPHQGSNHQPCGSKPSSLTTTLQAATLYSETTDSAGLISIICSSNCRQTGLNACSLTLWWYETSVNNNYNIAVSGNSATFCQMVHKCCRLLRCNEGHLTDESWNRRILRVGPVGPVGPAVL